MEEDLPAANGRPAADGRSDTQRAADMKFEDKIDEQLTALAGSIERLAARAQADLDENPPVTNRASPGRKGGMPAPRPSFVVGHMDALPSDNHQPLAVFCEFENLVCSLDTEAVLLSEPPANCDARLEAYAKLALPLKDALAKLEAEGAKLAPGFEDFAELCSIRQVRLFVLSHGLKPIIRHFLRQAGLGHIEVLANDLGFKPDGVWDVCLRDHSETGHDKGESLQQALRGSQLNARVIFVGSAASDFSVVETGLVNTLYAPSGSELALRCQGAALRARNFDGWEAMMGELQLI